jgi:two-component system, NtrC family, nitrogen regulation response regulator GlnG
LNKVSILPVEVLVLDTDSAVHAVVSGPGREVQRFADEARLLSRIRDGAGHVVVASAEVMTDVADLVREIKVSRSRLPVIVTSSANVFHDTIDALRSGAFECIPKPFDVGELNNLIDRAVDQSSRVERRTGTKVRVLGRAPNMTRVYSALARLARKAEPVLFRGEIGVGKKHLGRALHQYSTRSDGPFIVLPRAVADIDERELFGDAGAYDSARGGTLFIQEPARLPLSAQRRLAGILARQRLKPDDGDVRIMGSVLLGANGQQSDSFDAEFYHLISAYVIDVPPLRERTEDIFELLQHFVSLAGGSLPVEGNALAKFSSYHWPGNLQELDNYARRWAVFGGASELPVEATKPLKPGLSDSIQKSVEHYVRTEFDAGPMVRPGLYYRVIRQVEKSLLATTLQSVRDNKSRAAALLGINRNTLTAKLQQYEI